MSHNTELGRRGEQIAAKFLESNGLKLVEQNWRCSFGEIDIVAQENDVTVFVEVKTRSRDSHGHPFEAITDTKRARLRKLAAEWCTQHDAHGLQIRIDAVAVHVPPNTPALIEHIRGVL